MPRNPDKQQCTVEGCNGWAIRGSDPPRCSPHSGKAGAPEGNRNRLLHGFYATAVLPEELDDLGQETIDNTLAAEIAITRVALRRIFRMLVTGRTPGPDPESAACPGDSSGGGVSGRPLAAADYIRISALAFQGAAAISRLLRAHHDMGGQGISSVTLGIARGLQELFEGFPESFRERWYNGECTESELNDAIDALPTPDTRQHQR